jgi:hypothetical protein
MAGAVSLAQAVRMLAGRGDGDHTTAPARPRAKNASGFVPVDEGSVQFGDGANEAGQGR